MSGDTKRRRGGMSRYLSGGENSLVRRPPRPGENLERVGMWSREELLRMDDRYVSAVERAIKRGLEQRSSASACVRAGDRLPLAS